MLTHPQTQMLWTGKTSSLLHPRPPAARLYKSRRIRRSSPRPMAHQRCGLTLPVGVSPLAGTVCTPHVLIDLHILFVLILRGQGCAVLVPVARTLPRLLGVAVRRARGVLANSMRLLRVHGAKAWYRHTEPFPGSTAPRAMQGMMPHIPFCPLSSGSLHRFSSLFAWLDCSSCLTRNASSWMPRLRLHENLLRYVSMSFLSG